MGLFDWRSGTRSDPRAGEGASEDERAIARYRYLLNTAPPEAIERAHAEAFAQLTPEQRRLVLARLAENAPPGERARLEQAGADPQTLARAATRTEMRQPGALERMFGGSPMPGFGSMMAGSLLGSVAGTVLGSMIAREFFAQGGHGLADQASTGEGLPDDNTLTDSSDLDTGDLGGGFDGGTFDV
jgi:hypothetical protein